MKELSIMFGLIDPIPGGCDSEEIEISSGDPQRELVYRLMQLDNAIIISTIYKVIKRALKINSRDGGFVTIHG